MKPLLDAVLDALGSVVEFSGAAILTLDDAGETLTFAHWRGPRSFTPEAARNSRYQVLEFASSWEQLCSEEPIVVADVRADTPEARTFRRLVGEDDVDTLYSFIGSLMWVPLVVRGRIIGILSIANSKPDAFTSQEATLALAVARQSAIAIENARLHERTRRVAVLEERQRLSRELHDSVTQALYGISLYAEAASRALSDGESEPAVANLKEIRDTTQEALREMRLLLYELRPPLLEEHGLAAALRARLQAVETRAGLEVDFECSGNGRLPVGAEQELYRLAQEALNNVLKHAHASRVKVRLDMAADRARLDIADDGVGFEPALRGGDGYGLRGMRERVERARGVLQIDSSPGQGTRVLVEVPR
jgi:signal transduction histidine kinase